MSGISYAIFRRAHLRLSLRIEILIIGSTRLFLRNLVNRLMIVLLGSTPLLVAYILVVILYTLIINVLSNCYMRLMIMCGVCGV
jgi:hypothetical protein